MRRALDIGVDECLCTLKPAQVHLELSPGQDGLERQALRRFMDAQLFKLLFDTIGLARQMK